VKANSISDNFQAQPGAHNPHDVPAMLL